MYQQLNWQERSSIQDRSCQRKYKQQAKIIKTPWIWDYVVQHLRKKWSPEVKTQPTEC